MIKVTKNGKTVELIVYHILCNDNFPNPFQSLNGIVLFLDLDEFDIFVHDILSNHTLLHAPSAETLTPDGTL